MTSCDVATHSAASVSFIIRGESSFPKYVFLPGVGHARKTPQGNLRSVNLTQMYHDNGSAIDSPKRRLFYGKNLIRAALQTDKTHPALRQLNAAIKFAMRSVSDENERLKRPTPARVRGVEIPRVEHQQPYGVETLSFTSKFKLDHDDQIMTATVLRWSEKFLSFKWMKALMCRGTGASVCIDSSDSECETSANKERGNVDTTTDYHKWWTDNVESGDEDDEGDEEDNFHGGVSMRDINIGEYTCTNRRAIPGTTYAKRQCFDLARFQVLNKLETLGINWKMMGVQKYARLMLIILKTRIDMDYLTYDECQAVYDWLVKYSVFVTLVQRRLGKTVSHIANACMECVMFPTAGHMNMYVTGNGQLTSNAYQTMCTNIPEMVTEFNQREKINFLNMKQLTRPSVEQNHHHQRLEQKRNKNNRQKDDGLTFADYYLQGYTMKDAQRTAMAVCFKRYLLDGTCLDIRPFATNLFRCQIIVQKTVSELFLSLWLLPLLPLLLLYLSIIYPSTVSIS